MARQEFKQQLEFTYQTKNTRYIPRTSTEVKVLIGDTDKMDNRTIFSRTNDKVSIEVVQDNKPIFKGTYEDMCQRLEEKYVYIIPVDRFNTKLKLLDDKLYIELSKEYGTTLTLGEFNSIVKANQSYTIENYFRII